MFSSLISRCRMLLVWRKSTADTTCLRKLKVLTISFYVRYTFDRISSPVLKCKIHWQCFWMSHIDCLILITWKLGKTVAHPWQGCDQWTQTGPCLHVSPSPSEIQRWLSFSITIWDAGITLEGKQFHTNLNITGVLEDIQDFDNTWTNKNFTRKLTHIVSHGWVHRDHVHLS